MRRGRRYAGRVHRRNAEAPFAEFVVVVILVTVVASGLIVLARQQAVSVPELASVTFESDPPGATLLVHGIVRGTTPVTLELPKGRTTRYRLRAPEPFREYDLYRPFDGEVTPHRSSHSLQVWIERTDADEQHGQRRARGYGD